MSGKKSNILKIALAAVFCAVAYICTYLKVPVMFLSLEVKDAVIVLCTLILGPLWGLGVALLVPTLELITHSTTGVYGWVMNILSSVTFAMVTGLIYRFKKSFLGAILGLVCGIFSVTAVMMLANLLITPFYMGVSISDVAALIPKVLLPFNLVKATLNGGIVLLLYKPLSTVLKRMRLLEVGPSFTEQKVEKKSGILRTVIVSCVAVAVILGSLAIVFFVLK